MPVPQLLGGGLDGVEGCDGIDQVIDFAWTAVQVLGEQFQPEVAGEDPGPVALAGRIGRLPAVEPGVDDRAGELAVMGPGTPVEVVRLRRRFALVPTETRTQSFDASPGVRDGRGGKGAGFTERRRAVQIDHLHGELAVASRRVRGGRFHFSSIRRSAEVWSYTVEETYPGRA